MSKKGFTLVELLVVIAIIGLLSSIVFASLTSSRKKARVAQAQSVMRGSWPAMIECANAGVNLNAPSFATVTAICTGSTNNWPTLPAISSSVNWAYSSTNLTPDAFSVMASGDGYDVTCTNTGCSTGATPPPPAP